MYQKKIAYINYIENEVRIKNAGHVKILVKNEKFMIDLHIKGLYQTDSMLAEVTLKGAKQPVGRMCIDQGNGYYNACFPVGNVDEMGTDAEEVSGLEIILSTQRKLQAIWKEEATYREAKPEAETLRVAEHREKEKKIKALPKPESVQPLPKAESNLEKQDAKQESLYADKWEQLTHTYQRVHPCGRKNGVFINITPKDFVVMREQYQQLVHNSFLLHGYYNYGHIILGKKEEQEEVYYLGVPGSYYEREKMVAVMFGFESFEKAGGEIGSGMLEAGTFGYYFRKVEL